MWGKGGPCLEMTTLSTVCADCPEICEPQPPGTLRACSGLQWDFLPLLHHFVLLYCHYGVYEHKEKFNSCLRLF
jgi:hypothetical protein